MLLPHSKRGDHWQDPRVKISRVRVRAMGRVRVRVRVGVGKRLALLPSMHL